MTDIVVQYIFVIMTGLAFGSFVTLLSYRLPLEEDVVTKPSRCPKCESKLKFFDLWPVLSWMASKGRCRYCAAPISIRYPLIEIITASVFFLVFLKYGITAQTLIISLTWAALMVMIVADFEHYIIPDSIHFVLIALGMAYHFVMGTQPENIVNGFVAGCAIGLALHYGYRVIRKKEGLGFGDVKFLAVAGLWLGVKPLVPFLFFSGLFGIATGLVWRALGKGPIFPFGPALALSLFICLVIPELSKIFWNIGIIVNNTL